MGPGSLFDRLREACRPDWRAYVDHPFVQGLGNGTLSDDCFRYYLTQDYLFLLHFARAYGLAAYKSTALEDIRAASASLSAIVDREVQLHVRYCTEWGLSEAAMAGTEEDLATVSYTRYVLDVGLRGDLLDLLVVLAPCVIGYAEIGSALADRPAEWGKENPFRPWIDAYASRDYQAVAEAHSRHMDRLIAVRGGSGRLDQLKDAFRQATRLEVGFWDMGLNAAR